MSLLVHSHVVTLTFRLPDGVSLTRLVVGAEILVTKVVNTGERMIINMRVYAGWYQQVPYFDGGEPVHVSGCVCCVCYCVCFRLVQLVPDVVKIAADDWWDCCYPGRPTY